MWKTLLIFLGGVAAGSVVTLLAVQEYVDRRIEEEVDSVRETYARISVERAAEDDKKETARQNYAKKAELAKMITSSNQIIKDQKYNVFDNPYEGDTGTGDDEEEDIYADMVDMSGPSEGLAESPYVISQESFISDEPYFDKTTLNYYDDDILEEEITESIIEDIDAVVGRESLTKFGEYEDDVVFVRNERLRTDYEIIHQHRKFAEFPSEDDP